ncbi:MAG: hypothetical protein ACLFXM_13180 [Acidimicrobiia bacterium]
MPPTFRPGDDEAFESWRDDVVRRFEATAMGGGLGWVAHQVLDFKRSHLGGDLGRWTPGDVETILLELYPRAVVMELEDAPDVMAGFAGLVHFLAGDGLLEGGSAAAESLVDRLRGLTRAFPRALADRSRWSVGKRLVSAAAADGVDPTDPGAFDRWMAAFDQRPAPERERVLGGAPASGEPRARIPAMPPVVLAPARELQSAAAGSVLVTRVRRLVDFVGHGRPLTERGNLKLADGTALVELLGTGDRVDAAPGGRASKARSAADLTGVDLTFRLALATGLLAVEGRRVVPGADAAAAAADADPCDLAYRLLLGLVAAVGPVGHRHRSDPGGAGGDAEDIDQSLARTLLDLYRSRAARPVEEIAGEAWDLLAAEGGTAEVDLADRDGADIEGPTTPARRRVDGDVRYALDRLADLGVVTVAGVEDAVADPADPADRDTGRPVPLGGEVALTPLGLWAVQRLAATMTEAPVVGSTNGEAAG